MPAYSAERSRPGVVRVAWLLLATLLVTSAGCSTAPSPEQKKAMRKLQSVGGRVNFSRGGYEVDLRNSAVQDHDLAYLHDIENLKSVLLSGTHITDAGLEELYTLTTVETIDLTRTFAHPEAVA